MENASELPWKLVDESGAQKDSRTSEGYRSSSTSLMESVNFELSRAMTPAMSSINFLRDRSSARSERSRVSGHGK